MRTDKQTNRQPYYVYSHRYTWTPGAYHLAKKSGNFGCESNGTVIFRKIRSEIVDYLQR